MTTELQEAVNAATAASSASLIQKYISPRVLEYQRRFAPLLLAIETEKITTNRYNFIQRNRRPAGGSVADGGARTPSNSTWTQPGFDIKNYQAVGQVTGFAEAVTAGTIGSLLKTEMDGAMKSQMWAVETAIVYGNSAATLGLLSGVGQGPDFDGLEQFCNVYSGGLQNVIDGAANNLALTGTGGLDSLIDMVEENTAAAIGGDYMFIGSPKAINKIGGLLLNQQRFVDTTQIKAGLTVQTYRDIPLIKSSFLANRSQAMTTVAAATSTTGGTLAAATYYYVIVPVINRFGELAPSTEVSQVTTGSTSTVTLTFTAPTDSEGNEAVLYKVFRSTSTNNETLLGVVAATDQTGGATLSIVDNGTNLLANGLTPTGSTPTAYVGTNASTKPKAAGQEDFYLVPRDPDFLLRPYVRDFFVKPLAQTIAAPDAMPFYVQNDTTLAVRGPKYVGRISRLQVVL